MPGDSDDEINQLRTAALLSKPLKMRKRKVTLTSKRKVITGENGGDRREVFIGANSGSLTRSVTIGRAAGKTAEILDKSVLSAFDNKPFGSEKRPKLDADQRILSVTEENKFVSEKDDEVDNVDAKSSEGVSIEDDVRVFLNKPEYDASENSEEPNVADGVGPVSDLDNEELDELVSLEHDKEVDEAIDLISGDEQQQGGVLEEKPLLFNRLETDNHGKAGDPEKVQGNRVVADDEQPTIQEDEQDTIQKNAKDAIQKDVNEGTDVPEKHEEEGKRNKGNTSKQNEKDGKKDLNSKGTELSKEISHTEEKSTIELKKKVKGESLINNEKAPVDSEKASSTKDDKEKDLPKTKTNHSDNESSGSDSDSSRSTGTSASSSSSSSSSSRSSSNSSSGSESSSGSDSDTDSKADSRSDSRSRSRSASVSSSSYSYSTSGSAEKKATLRSVVAHSNRTSTQRRRSRSRSQSRSRSPRNQRTHRDRRYARRSRSNDDDRSRRDMRDSGRISRGKGLWYSRRRSLECRRREDSRSPSRFYRRGSRDRSRSKERSRLGEARFGRGDNRQALRRARSRSPEESNRSAADRVKHESPLSRKDDDYVDIDVKNVTRDEQEKTSRGEKLPRKKTNFAASTKPGFDLRSKLGPKKNSKNHTGKPGRVQRQTRARTKEVHETASDQDNNEVLEVVDDKEQKLDARIERIRKMNEEIKKRQEEIEREKLLYG